MNLLESLLPDPQLIECLHFDLSDNQSLITLHLASKVKLAHCPRCHEPTDRVHSQYQRKFADLPLSDKALQCTLRVQKYFCDNPACEQKIFCERLPSFIRAWGRRTERLRVVQQQVGLAVGGAPGKRLSEHLCMPGGVDLFLTLARQIDLTINRHLRCVGVDDWAQRKGSRYGTIVIDHETSDIVDILPDRTVETLKAWLESYPSIEVVSRDRAASYAQAIKESLPKAKQVADRWHLLKNLTDVIYKITQRHHGLIQSSFKEITGENQLLAECLLEDSPTPADTLRRQRMATAQELFTQGLTHKEIARRLGCHPKTISRDLAGQTSHSATRRTRTSILDPYKPYLRQRVQAGCCNAAILFEEIKQQGYPGQITIVRTFLKPRALKRWVASEDGSEKGNLIMKQRSPSAKAVAFLISKQAKELTDTQSSLLDALAEKHNHLAMIIEMGREFAKMVRQRSPEKLNPWLLKAKRSPLKQLRNFAVGICRDYAAVRAALELDYSNGPTEGHINRLKCVKRQMYGRANFDLLRARLLAV